MAEAPPPPPGVDPGAIPPSRPTSAAAPVVASPRLAALGAEVGGDPGAEARFWHEVATAGTPLVEPVPGAAGERIATFVWRGRPTTRAVELRANKLHRRDRPERSALARLPGTDVWSLSYRLPADWRGSYVFLVDDGAGATERPDPHNLATLPQREGPPRSVASLPAAPAQPGPARPGVARGPVTEHVLASDLLGNERRVWAHVGAGAAGPLPVLVVLDGATWVEAAPLGPVLDGLVAAGALAPRLTLLVDSLDPAVRSVELTCHRPFVDMLAKELLGWAAERWAVAEDPGRRMIAGQSLGGLAALHAALEAPDVFGAALVQSGSFWWRNGDDGEHGPEWLTGRVAAAPADRLRCFMEVGRDEGPNLGPNRRMHRALVAAGHQVTYREYSGGHDLACWRGGLADGLVALAGSGPGEAVDVGDDLA